MDYFHVKLVHHVGTEAKYTFGNIWIKNGLEGDNSTLVRELDTYKKRYIEAKRKIQKVPNTLRGVKCNKCYDPQIVAIGPYHHDNVELKQMETFKFHFALQYAFRSGKLIEKLYEEMENQLIGAMNYYDEDVVKTFNDKKFAEMLFLDSCFVIQFMDSCVNPRQNDIETTYIDETLIKRDIMLLENQLPLEILTKLMNLSSRFGGHQGNEMIDKFIKQIMSGPPIKEAQKSCFWFCCPNSKSEETSKEQEEPICTKEEAPNSKSEGSSGKEKEDHIHLLELVQTKFVNVEEIERGKSKEPYSNYWCSYRSIKELKSVGIYFDSSKSSRFSDITFNSMYLLCGRLSLPRITIGDDTKSLLLNLVAFETCADTSSNFGVSSYVYFMDGLIDCAEDVKELRSKDIVVNLLGSDEQVANLFNEIGENVLFDGEVFGSVKNSLNAFYKSNPSLWLAECWHNYFRSPWAIIAFFAAIVILGLTITQTVFSAIQL